MKTVNCPFGLAWSHSQGTKCRWQRTWKIDNTRHEYINCTWLQILANDFIGFLRFTWFAYSVPSFPYFFAGPHAVICAKRVLQPIIGFHEVSGFETVWYFSKNCRWAASLQTNVMTHWWLILTPSHSQGKQQCDIFWNAFSSDAVALPAGNGIGCWMPKPELTPCLIIALVTNLSSSYFFMKPGCTSWNQSHQCPHVYHPLRRRPHAAWVRFAWPLALVFQISANAKWVSFVVPMGLAELELHKMWPGILTPLRRRKHRKHLLGMEHAHVHGFLCGFSHRWISMEIFRVWSQFIHLR